MHFGGAGASLAKVVYSAPGGRVQDTVAAAARQDAGAAFDRSPADWRVVTHESTAGPSVNVKSGSLHSRGSGGDLVVRAHRLRILHHAGSYTRE